MSHPQNRQQQIKVSITVLAEMLVIFAVCQMLRIVVLFYSYEVVCVLCTHIIRWNFEHHTRNVLMVVKTYVMVQQH